MTSETDIDLKPDESVAPRGKHFPLFTIVTITLNHHKGLQKTFASLQSQSFDDYEWLVIDGGSTDKSVNFLRKHRSETRAAKNPFRFISEGDDGIYDAMNKGMDEARGHYILFLNAGDCLADPDVLATLAPYTESKPQFIYGDALEDIGKNPILKPANRYKDLIWGMFTHHQAMIYRRHTVRDFKIKYSLLYTVASDYDFTVRFLQRAKRIIYIPTPICIFEQGGLSQTQASKGRREQYIIREKMNMVPLPMNFWILTVQILTFTLRTYAPWLYWLLRK